MIVFLIILVVLSILVSSFGIWALGKLNKYIARLESVIDNQLDRIDELEDLIQQSNIKSKKIVKREIIKEDE